MPAPREQASELGEIHRISPAYKCLDHLGSAASEARAAGDIEHLPLISYQEDSGKMERQSLGYCFFKR